MKNQHYPSTLKQDLAIMQLKAEGVPVGEIGERLYKSPRTIENHLRRIRRGNGREEQ